MESELLLMQEEDKKTPITGGRSEENQYEPQAVLAPETRPVLPKEPNIEYHDMGKLGFINNSIIAELIRMVRSALKQGRELRFINVPAALSMMIRKMGLSDIIKCS